MGRVMIPAVGSPGGASPSSADDRWLLCSVEQFLIRTFDRIGAWQERAAGRRRLMHLDERMLRDIGFDPASAAEEANKPFWKN
jgi:uncharacterized protein YjiS (DUF1127 family)